MREEIFKLEEDIRGSPLYSEDLAPVPSGKRNWNTWNMTAIWIGMAVTIPTYLLASYMITSGLGWVEALVIIGLANVIVTVPMVLNGHAGVRYGIPFPVLGRAAFGVRGVHIPSLARGIVACGWFGIQTWIGGQAIYAIWCVITGTVFDPGLSFGKFVGFGLFWLINIAVIWNGTENIRRLENLAAPILLLMGVILIAWGTMNGGGFANVLRQSEQLQRPTARITNDGGGAVLELHPLVDQDGNLKASGYRIGLPAESGEDFRWLRWQPLTPEKLTVRLASLPELSGSNPFAENPTLSLQFRNDSGDISSQVTVSMEAEGKDPPSRWFTYLFWLTAMVGFWATMSISIADITRYVGSQREQIAGQFLGLPGTMLLYSFIGIFVTSASIILFGDVLIAEDVPWDPVNLVAKFHNPFVVVVAQVFLLIATLTTNIAANVIAPANIFANALPKRINFRRGGVITGLIGIAVVPWWLLNEISNILIFVSGLLGPVLGVLLSDYYYVRRTQLNVMELYKTDGEYTYRSGFNPAAITALAAGVLLALVGYWVPQLGWLYTLSWFTGFIVSFAVYAALMRPPVAANPD